MTSDQKIWDATFDGRYLGTGLQLGDKAFDIKVNHEKNAIAVLVGSDVVVQPLKDGVNGLTINDHMLSTDLHPDGLEVHVGGRRVLSACRTPLEKKTDRHEQHKKTLVHHPITLIYESPEFVAGVAGDVILCERASVDYFPKIVDEMFPKPTPRQRELVKFLVQSAEGDVCVPFSAHAMCYLLEGLQGVEREIPDQYRLAVQDLAVYYEVPIDLVFQVRSAI